MFLATKPQDAAPAIEASKSRALSDTVYVSLVGDYTSKMIESMIGPGARVIRMVPNAQTEKHQDITWGTIRGENVSDQDMKDVCQLLGKNASVSAKTEPTSEPKAPIFSRPIPIVRSRKKTSKIVDTSSKDTECFGKRYKLGKLLGQGTYSSVYEGFDKSLNHSKFAVKCIPKKNQDDIKADIAALSQLEHKNIIGLHGVYTEGDMQYMVTDFCNESLYSIIQEKRHFTESTSKHILKQVLEALEYVHASGFVHRDIKAENILVNRSIQDNGVEKYHVKLADFGLSYQLSSDAEKLHTVCGSAGYLSPEIVCGRTYGKSADIWSAGVLAYILLFGRPPFYHEDEAHLFKLIKQGLYNTHANNIRLSPQGLDFLTNMLEVDADMRMSAPQLLRHPWLSV